MKKQLLAIAVSAASVAPMASMAQPELYGRFDVTVQSSEALSQANGSKAANGQNTITTGTSPTTTQVGNLPVTVPGTGRYDGSATGDQWEARSNTSMIGVRGEKGLDTGLSAIYQLEMQFNWVASNTPNFTNRNSFAGLKGEEWGKVFVGRFDSIVKDAEFSVDQFGYTDADIAVLFRNQNRYNNTINYHSPKIGPGIQVKAQVIPGASRQNIDNDDRQTSIADGYGLSIGMEEGNMYGAIAYQTNVQPAGNLMNTPLQNGTNTAGRTDDADVQTFRVSGGLDDDQFGVGFIYDMTETSAEGQTSGISYDDGKSGWLVSGRFNPTTDLAVKAQYGDSETRFLGTGDNDDRSITSASLGADYMLGKQTKLYTFYTMNGVDGEDVNNNEDDSEFNVLAFGMQHKF